MMHWMVHDTCLMMPLLNCCRFFGALHLEACKLLASICLELGQRALVGLVCMDRNSPDTYTKSTEQNLADTEAFIQHVRGLGSDLVQPVVTPRFVPTCTPELLAGLGEVAQGQAVLVQSHISESHDEVVSTGCITSSQEWLCWATFVC